MADEDQLTPDQTEKVLHFQVIWYIAILNHRDRPYIGGGLTPEAAVSAVKTGDRLLVYCGHDQFNRFCTAHDSIAIGQACLFP